MKKRLLLALFLFVPLFLFGQNSFKIYELKNSQEEVKIHKGKITNEITKMWVVIPGEFVELTRGKEYLVELVSRKSLVNNTSQEELFVPRNNYYNHNTVMRNEQNYVPGVLFPLSVTPKNSLKYLENQRELIVEIISETTVKIIITKKELYGFRRSKVNVRVAYDIKKPFQHIIFYNISGEEIGRVLFQSTKE